MPAVQTSYATTMRVAFAGLKGDTAPEVILTRQVETTGGIGFGLAVTQGTGDRQVTVTGTTPKAFIGITLVDQTAAGQRGPVPAGRHRCSHAGRQRLGARRWCGHGWCAGDLHHGHRSCGREGRLHHGHHGHSKRLLRDLGG
jgi:hypothetical protein